MGNSLRLCVACLLPCGALDVVRVVHISGRVDELSRPATAGEIMAANPGHFITKLCSRGVASHRILIVSPEAELKRGHIYLVIPAAATEKRKKKRSFEEEKMAEEPPPEKKAGTRRRKSGRVAVWRPNLESIFEEL